MHGEIGEVHADEAVPNVVARLRLTHNVGQAPAVVRDQEHRAIVKNLEQISRWTLKRSEPEDEHDAHECDEVQRGDLHPHMLPGVNQNQRKRQSPGEENHWNQEQRVFLISRIRPGTLEQRWEGLNESLSPVGGPTQADVLDQPEEQDDGQGGHEYAGEVVGGLNTAELAGPFDCVQVEQREEEHVEKELHEQSD